MIFAVLLGISGAKKTYLCSLIETIKIIRSKFIKFFFIILLNIFTLNLKSN